MHPCRKAAVIDCIDILLNPIVFDQHSLQFFRRQDQSRDLTQYLFREKDFVVTRSIDSVKHLFVYTWKSITPKDNTVIAPMRRKVKTIFGKGGRKGTDLQETVASKEESDDERSMEEYLAKVSLQGRCTAHRTTLIRTKQRLDASRSPKIVS